MATITINIPDDKVTEVVDAFANRFQYTLNKLPTETKAQFAKRMTAAWIKQIYQAQTAEEASEASKAASLSTTSTVDIN